MSVGSRRTFSKPFQPFLFDVLRIDVPVPGNEENVYQQLEKLAQRDDVAGFIYEPLVLGTAGMVMYEPEALDRMVRICQQNDVITIADEVMTGYGRTGKFWASDYCETDPDIVCMSKGVTGGTLAIGLTSCSQKIYNAYVSEDQTKTFFHGHSYTANPLACAASLANLDLMEREQTKEQVQWLTRQHQQFANQMGDHPMVRSCRHMGTIFALEVETGGETSYFSEAGPFLSQYFKEHGVLTRPLGNVIYIMPPFCIEEDQLEKVYQVFQQGIETFADQQKTSSS